jgi:hypothetical protein
MELHVGDSNLLRLDEVDVLHLQRDVGRTLEIVDRIS